MLRRLTNSNIFMRSFHYEYAGKTSETNLIVSIPSTKDSIWWNGFIQSLANAKKLIYNDVESFRRLCEKAQQFINLFHSDPNSRSWIKSFIPYQYDLLNELIKQKEESAKLYFELINKNIESIKLSLQKNTKLIVTTKLLERHIRNYAEIEKNMEQWKKMYGGLKTWVPFEVCSKTEVPTIKCI